MPKKKITKRTKATKTAKTPRVKRNTSRASKNNMSLAEKMAAPMSMNPLSKITWSESYVSLLLGILVVLVAGVFIFMLFRNHKPHMTQSTSSTATVDNEKVEFLKQLNLPKKYTVVSGDDLVKISEKFYKSGDHWIDIARANNISNPNSVSEGTTIVIPTLAPQKKQPAVSQSQQNMKTYTLQDGESIWDAAVKMYNDGYRWPDIAKANNLDNPDQVIAGMVLKIPR